jgi:carbon monoxide dehydrogenase subunit G
MAHLSESITVNASRETIWSLLTTPAKILQWFVGLDTVNASADYPAVGSYIEGAYKVMGIELKAKQTVTAMTPGEAIHYQLEGIVSGAQHWDVTPAGDGLQITVTMDYTMSGGVLGRVAEPAVHQVNLANAKKSLENIKQLAEN